MNITIPETRLTREVTIKTELGKDLLLKPASFTAYFSFNETGTDGLRWSKAFLYFGLDRRGIFSGYRHD